MDGTWTEPVNPGPPINGPMGEDEPNISPDGQYVVFQSWKEGWDTSGGPYYQSELSGDEWGKPAGLGGEIHRFFIDKIRRNDWYFATDGSSISPDGKIFIFAAGKWYDEPMDLFISFRRDGKWTYPEKMILNTRGDERSVFIAADSRTLFFSSSGLGGFGGLDIYKTVLDSAGHPGDIINLGKTFNTGKDESGFTMNASAREIYFTRDADMIQVVFEHPDRRLQTLPTLLISGTVTDFDGKPVEAEIRVSTMNDNQTVAKARSNSLSGTYSLVIPKAEKRYVKEINAENFRKYREEIVAGDPGMNSQIETHDLLKRIHTELIFFDLDDPAIRDSETEKLDSIAGWLSEHNKPGLQLTGHTDQPGSNDYNLDLSRKRVENVKLYFEQKGIPGRVIRTRFLGESSPLENLPGGAESQLNRRVEVKILLNEE
jgi:outer membrane protein OmpA-like peptidoglycan-associated protein